MPCGALSRAGGARATDAATLERRGRAIDSLRLARQRARAAECHRTRSDHVDGPLLAIRFACHLRCCPGKHRGSRRSACDRDGRGNEAARTRQPAGRARRNRVEDLRPGGSSRASRCPGDNVEFTHQEAWPGPRPVLVRGLLVTRVAQAAIDLDTLRTPVEVGRHSRWEALSARRRDGLRRRSHQARADTCGQVVIWGSRNPPLVNLRCKLTV